MKILMFGRGVIATQYGWALEKAGNTVEFYVRPGRAAEYGPTVKLDIRDARRNRRGEPVVDIWPTVLREDLDAHHDYDLIIVSVHHDKFAEAVTYLAPRIGAATLLVFNNLASDPRRAISGLPSDQVVWGFPGAGGGFDDTGTLKGGFTRFVFFGTLGTEQTERDKAVRELFRRAGFSISGSRDFASWLLFHFIMDTAFGVQSVRAGGVSGLMDSWYHIHQMLLGIRALLPLLRARGGRVEPSLFRIVLRLPVSLTALLMWKTAFRRGSMGRHLMEAAAVSHAVTSEFRVYPRDALAEAHRLGVSLPWLEAARPLFELR